MGRPKYKPVLPTANQSEYQVGNFKDESRGLLKIKYPINHGVIRNWNDMDILWRYSFNELNINPKEVI